MITILKGTIAEVHWRIIHTANKISEDFTGAELKIFLAGPDNVYSLSYDIVRVGGYNEIHLSVESSTLSTGVYDLKAVWVKNKNSIPDVVNNQFMSVSRRGGVFSVTDNPGETTPIPVDGAIKLMSYVESYGRDGMSAYEIAVFRGLDFEGSEKEWIENIVSGGGNNGNGIPDILPITTEKLDDNAVTWDKLNDAVKDRITDHEKRIAGLEANGECGTTEIGDGSITTAKLKDKSVTKSKIDDKAIEENHLSDEVKELIGANSINTTLSEDGSLGLFISEGKVIYAFVDQRISPTGNQAIIKAMGGSENEQIQVLYDLITGDILTRAMDGIDGWKEWENIKGIKEFKTINGESIVGAGDITISGEGGTNITVEDNLTSTSTTSALSANQGKILDDKIKESNAGLISLKNRIKNLAYKDSAELLFADVIEGGSRQYINVKDEAANPSEETTDSKIYYVYQEDVFVLIPDTSTLGQTGVVLDAYTQFTDGEMYNIYGTPTVSRRASVFFNETTGTLQRIVDTDEGDEEQGKMINIVDADALSGALINYPNGEDFEIKGGKLSLKDRKAEDGMGYVILRKDKSLYAQLDSTNGGKANTIYEIRYDFEAGVTPIELPSNCVLNFNGGSINNGTLIGNNTLVSAYITKIFSNMILEGTFKGDGYVEWLGASTAADDNREYIQQCVNTFKNTLLKGLYKVGSADTEGNVIVVPEGHAIIGEKVGTVDTVNDGFELTNSTVTCVLKLSNGCQVENIGIKGVKSSDESHHTVGISSENTRSIWLKNCIISGFDYGIKMNTFLTQVQRVECWYCNYGFVFEGVAGNPYTSVNLVNCYASFNAIAGYTMKYMIYSCLQNCACDCTNRYVLDNSVNESKNVVAAYNFESAQNINLINCGAEQNIRLFKCDNCSSIKLESCNIQVKDSDLVALEETKHHLARQIYVRFSSKIQIENCKITFMGGYTGAYTYVDDYRDTVTILESDCIAQDKITYYDNGYAGINLSKTVRLPLKYAAITSGLEHYPNLNNLTENREYIYTIDGIQKYISDVTWEDYTKSSILRIKGLNTTTPNRLMFDMANIKIIKGFKQVVFENLLIEVSSQWGEGKEHVLEFVDTDVRFVDCIFYIDGAKTTSLFNIDNSIITWINSYEYSYSTYRRNLQNVNAHLDYATLLSGYDTTNRVLLPVGAQVTLSDGRKGVFVGEDAIQVYDGGIKIVDASGALKS